MTRFMIASLMVLSVAACGSVTEKLGLDRFRKQVETPSAEPLDAIVPQDPAVTDAVLAPATAAPPPPAAARTVEALDTTTAAQRAAAAAPAATPTRVLGRTVASLGAATEPGLWLKTPLVDMEMQGRVTNPATGKSSIVTLIPIEGPVTAGSRMSLAALRLIGASLTDLTEVEVSVEG